MLSVRRGVLRFARRTVQSVSDRVLCVFPVLRDEKMNKKTAAAPLHHSMTVMTGKRSPSINIKSLIPGLLYCEPSQPAVCQIIATYRYSGCTSSMALHAAWEWFCDADKACKVSDFLQVPRRRVDGGHQKHRSAVHAV